VTIQILKHVEALVSDHVNQDRGATLPPT
jgi:hypothetical protein